MKKIISSRTIIVWFIITGMFAAAYVTTSKTLKTDKSKIKTWFTSKP
ncbi:MAG: hypothetical protein K2U26_01620 [Cyclobacteriaceae bacterium]|nr:hypothetical protein [Cyclobacteriaceae bacterium]